MWSFTISNNSRRAIKSATLHFSIKPGVITVLTSGEEPHSQTPSKKIIIDDVTPKASVVVQVWNMGGHITSGLDCYLDVEGKIVRPKVFGFEDERE